MRRRQAALRPRRRQRMQKAAAEPLAPRRLDRLRDSPAARLAHLDAVDDDAGLHRARRGRRAFRCLGRLARVRWRDGDLVDVEHRVAPQDPAVAERPQAIEHVRVRDMREGSYDREPRPGGPAPDRGDGLGDPAAHDLTAARKTAPLARVRAEQAQVVAQLRDAAQRRARVLDAHALLQRDGGWISPISSTSGRSSRSMNWRA